MIYVLLFSTLATALVVYLYEVYTRFSRYGVKTSRPLPILGNALDSMMKKQHIAEEMLYLFNRFPNERFIGKYEFMKPLVMVHDIDLVKKITIKDFEHFLDHRTFVSKGSEPLFARNLLMLTGQEWKDMRSTLSPAFTSSKMRLMVPFMIEVNETMIKSIKRKIEASGTDYVDLECKDLTSRYTNDVIACCAFGLKVDSHTDENNEFYAMGTKTATFGIRQILVFLFSTSFPKLAEKMNLTFFSKVVTKFFRSLVMTTMKEREEKHIIRHDMIHLLMEAKKGKLSHDEKAQDTNTGFATVEEFDIGNKTVDKEWSDDDLIAQAVLFFVAGYETVSSAMSFLLYELAVNPDVQDRLVKEIRDQDAKTGGKLDFDSVQSLTYLDMVVSELLRRWPPAVGMDRLCIKDYNLGKPNAEAKEDFILRKGEGVLIPTWAFHHNPEFFPDPYKFDPERFSEENKHNIKPFTYTPFGLGPRNCIGSRFALCEVKIMIYQLLQHIEIIPCEKTQIPAKLARDTFNLKIEGGHWLRFQVRK